MKAILKENIFDIFSIKNGSKKQDPLSPMILHFTFKYANKRVHADQKSLKWNCT